MSHLLCIYVYTSQSQFLVFCGFCKSFPLSIQYTLCPLHPVSEFVYFSSLLDQQLTEQNSMKSVTFKVMFTDMKVLSHVRFPVYSHIHFCTSSSKDEPACVNLSQELLPWA